MPADLGAGPLTPVPAPGTSGPTVAGRPAADRLMASIAWRRGGRPLAPADVADVVHEMADYEANKAMLRYDPTDDPALNVGQWQHAVADALQGSGAKVATEDPPGKVTGEVDAAGLVTEEMVDAGYAALQRHFRETGGSYTWDQIVSAVLAAVAPDLIAAARPPVCADGCQLHAMLADAEQRRHEPSAPDDMEALASRIGLTQRIEERVRRECADAARAAVDEHVMYLRTVVHRDDLDNARIVGAEEVSMVVHALAGRWSTPPTQDTERGQET